MSKNTIEYGISNLHYAIVTYNKETNETSYGKPKPIKGTTTLTLDVVGENTSIYADNTAYYNVTSNQGYSGSLTIITPTSEFLNEVYDLLIDGNQVSAEFSNRRFKEIALGFQVQGDQEERRIWLYRVTVSRPVQEHKTQTDNIEADTYAIAFKAIPRQDDNAIKTFVYKNSNEALYKSWFDEVYKITKPPIKPQLTTVITSPNLNPFQGVGDTPTREELETQVITDNPLYHKSDAIFSEITENNALAIASPNGKYQGNVGINYQYTKK